MYTIKKTRIKGKAVVYTDTYTLETNSFYQAQVMFSDIVGKEVDWLLLSNIKATIQLFKNDKLQNEINLNIKNK